MTTFTIKTLFGERRHGVRYSSGDYRNLSVVTFCGLNYLGRDIPGVVTCGNCIRTTGFRHMIASQNNRTDMENLRLQLNAEAIQ